MISTITFIIAVVGVIMVYVSKSIEEKFDTFKDVTISTSLIASNVSPIDPISLSRLKLKPTSLAAWGPWVSRIGDARKP